MLHSGRIFLQMTQLLPLKFQRPLLQSAHAHEMIHSRQQAELLWLGFYLWYVVEWIVRLAIYRNGFKAYRSISFEREAYAKQGEIGYLKKRKLFAWREFLRAE